MSPAVVEKIVGALIEAAPTTLAIIERLCAAERARRVEDVRPETGHAESAVERLRGGNTP